MSLQRTIHIQATTISVWNFRNRNKAKILQSATGGKWPRKGTVTREIWQYSTIKQSMKYWKACIEPWILTHDCELKNKTFDWLNQRTKGLCAYLSTPTEKAPPQYLKWRPCPTKVNMWSMKQPHKEPRKLWQRGAFKGTATGKLRNNGSQRSRKKEGEILRNKAPCRNYISWAVWKKWWAGTTGKSSTYIKRSSFYFNEKIISIKKKTHTDQGAIKLNADYCRIPNL